MSFKPLGILAGFVVFAALVTLAVANRHAARLVLDPFNPQSPAISMELPFYGFLIGALIVGVGIGGFSTWISQGKWRRLVRIRTHESLRWKAEAERLMRERDAGVTEKKRLAIAGGRR